MAYPTGTNYPQQFTQTQQVNPYAAAPALPSAAPLGGPPAGGGFELPPGGPGQPQDAFSLQQQATGAAPQQPGAGPQPDGAEGFADKNSTLSGGWASKVYSPKGMLASAAALLGAVYVTRGATVGRWDYKFLWDWAKEDTKALANSVKELSEPIKKEITEGVQGLADNFETHLAPVAPNPTTATVQKAKDAFQPLLDKIRKLGTETKLSTEDAKIHQGLIDAVENPLKTAHTAIGKTEANEKLPVNFLTESKTKFEKAHEEFSAKFDDDLKAAETKTSDPVQTKQTIQKQKVKTQEQLDAEQRIQDEGKPFDPGNEVPETTNSFRFFKLSTWARKQ